MDLTKLETLEPLPAESTLSRWMRGTRAAGNGRLPASEPRGWKVEVNDVPRYFTSITKASAFAQAHDAVVEVVR
jgi:hypothetical protein